MTQLTPARTRLALLALALGGFGIGTTEFVAMGLLPDIARDLLPALYASSHEEALAKAGLMISAYAAGVVVGAPTIAAIAARFPRKKLLAWLTVAFTLGTIASALAPTFETVVAFRFLAGLPHGAYFGVAALVAAELMGKGQRGRAVAFVLAGLTVANVVGVPAITFLGQHTSWRVAYLAVAAIFAMCTAAILTFVPEQDGDPHATIGRELGAFKRPAVWLALLTGALGFGGLFAVYTYVSPLATEVAGTPERFVPVALIVLGIGTTIGNIVGGRMADRDAMMAVFWLFGALAFALLTLALLARTIPGLLLGLFLVGLAASAISPAIQTRLMDVAGDAQTMAAAVNHAALNIGNWLGAFLGGVVIAAGWGYVAPTWVGLALCVPGAAFAFAGWTVTRASLESLPLGRQVQEETMPRPTSKPELLDASAASFDKLMALIASLSQEQLEAEFAFEDRDRNVRDVLIHLHEWHRLLIEWAEANLAGEARPFLPDGYTWTDYAPMNVGFRDEHADTSVEDALALVRASRDRVRELIQDRSDPELFEKRHYPWTGTTSLGAYCISATSSHDDWAMKKLRKHARG